MQFQTKLRKQTAFTCNATLTKIEQAGSRATPQDWERFLERCGGDECELSRLGRDHIYELLEYKKPFSLGRGDNNRTAPEAFPLSVVKLNTISRNNNLCALALADVSECRAGQDDTIASNRLHPSLSTSLLRPIPISDLFQLFLTPQAPGSASGATLVFRLTQLKIISIKIQGRFKSTTSRDSRRSPIDRCVYKL